MKTLLLVLAILAMTSVSYGADVVLKWDASTGATGYKIYMAIDGTGAVWQTPKDAGNVLTYTYTAVPEDRLILFRVSAYNAVGEIITTDKGAWFDGRKTLPKVTYNLGVQ